MGILLSCQSITKSYSSRSLFEEISLSIEDDQKIGLIGPNGAGKSTFLKIISGLVDPDEGSIVTRKGLRVAYVAQEDAFPADQSIEQIICGTAQRVPFLDHERAASIDSILAKMSFPDRQAKAGSLSGGWTKRLALACGLVTQPELLLLDEPTNHLDLHGVLWLEKLLQGLNIGLVIVSHDRAFLEDVTNRTIELNKVYPSGYLSISGSFSNFLQSRDEQVRAQQNLEQSLASKVRREIAWLQRGARARQTKARGRIQQAGKLIDELAAVKERNTSNVPVEISFDSSGRKTKELISVKALSKSFNGKPLFSDLSFMLTSGFKLGLTGRNGSGKTTLLKLLVGSLNPDSGTVKRADDLKIVWFDQNRQQLDKSKSLWESLCPSGDHVIYRGRSLHVATWAKKFLFRSDQLNMPISYLSGGEQARILIANLMLQPADVLILDEPTNDLDIPSLEVLEDSLEDFPGAVVLVTHDRMMLDTVSTRILSLEGNGKAQFYADYEQFEDLSAQQEEPPSPVQSSAEKKTQSGKQRSGLSTAEKRELTALPDKIDEVETSIAQLQREMEKPQVASNYAKLQELMKQQEAQQQALERLFHRWEELEAKAAAGSDTK